MTALISSILTALAPIVTFIINRLIKSANEKDATKDKNANGRAKYDDFKARCLKYVTQVDIEYVHNIKETAYNSINGNEAKQKAKELIRDSYGLDGLTDLAVFFDVDAKGLDRIIDLQIEQAILEMKN